MPSLRSRPSSFSVPPAAAAGRWAGFTLIELMVTLVILSILAALTLMGLAGVRRNAKIAKTKNTIRKIDAVIRPMYDSYRTRRVTLDASGNRRDASLEKLARLRFLMATEMPDSWAEITLFPPPFSPSAAARRYIREKDRLEQLPRFKAQNPATGSTYGDLYAAAETLFLIVAYGGYEPDALESFRPDEIGDVDGDGAREFLDAWGQPIMFVRWPIGYQPVSGPPPAQDPDPLDPFRQTGDFAVLPLIYSSGPEGSLYDPLGAESGYGVRSDVITPPWPQLLVTWLLEGGTPTWTWAAIDPPAQRPGSVLDPAKARDNITNHDLLRK